MMAVSPYRRLFLGSLNISSRSAAFSRASFIISARSGWPSCSSPEGVHQGLLLLICGRGGRPAGGRAGIARSSPNPRYAHTTHSISPLSRLSLL